MFQKTKKIYENHSLDNIRLGVGCPIVLQNKIVVLVRKCLFLKVVGALLNKHRKVFKATAQ